MTPLWLRIARQDIGLKEMSGQPTAPKIAGWLADLGAWWRDDETPWCGTAVAAWMRSAGIERPKAWYRAKSWLDWGLPLSAPVVGCVVVFERPGGGHVGLVEGLDSRGNLMVLGGNQGDAVSVKPFELGRVLGYRWPNRDLPVMASLPVFESTASVSRQEA